MFDPSKYRIVDLTLPYHQGMKGYDFETATTVEKDGWNSRTLHFYSHAGTHMDAPLHFGASEATIDDYEPDRFIGKAWVIKVPVRESRQLITIHDLGGVKDQFEKGDSLILQTGWSRYVGLPKYRDELPRISKGLATWCVENRVNMLGVEPPSVADVNCLAEVTEIHLILLGGGVIIIEGLTNLDQIQKDQVVLMAFPIKVEGGDGAPARVMAFEE